MVVFMAATIENILESLEELLDEAVSVPFSNGKRVVDVDLARDIIDDIKINLPQEILQAKAIVQDRANILQRANKEAEDLIRRAEERARYLIDREEIVKKATEQAKEIRSVSLTQAAQLKSQLTQFCDSMLISTQEHLTKSLNEVKSAREALKK